MHENQCLVFIRITFLTKFWRRFEAWDVGSDEVLNGILQESGFTVMGKV